MGLTRRSDSYYVEFRVLDDGDTSRLTNAGLGQLKRWKVGCLNKAAAKQQEALIKTKLLTGQMPSPKKAAIQSTTFRQWAAQYLALEHIKALKGYAGRKLYVENLLDSSATNRLARSPRTMSWPTEASGGGTNLRPVRSAQDGSDERCVPDADGSDTTPVSPYRSRPLTMTT